MAGGLGLAGEVFGNGGVAVGGLAVSLSLFVFVNFVFVLVLSRIFKFFLSRVEPRN